MNNKIKEIIRHFVCLPPVNLVLRNLPLQHSKILFYHGVALSPDATIETESIPVDVFVKQLDYIKKNYKVVSIDEFLYLYLNKELNGNEVVLTFDDGYKNILTTAAPILADYNLPYSLYITTNNISNGRLFPTTINRLIVYASSLKRISLESIKQDFDLSTERLKIEVQNRISKILKTQPIEMVDSIVSELESQISDDEYLSLRNKYSSIEPLAWDEVKQLSAESLITIGSHGKDHICCHSKQSESALRSQIFGSKEEIENKLNIQCDVFSYPNGNYTELSNSLLKEAGYKCGLSTKRWDVYKGSEYAIPRLYVPYDYERFVYSMVTYPF